MWGSLLGAALLLSATGARAQPADPDTAVGPVTLMPARSRQVLFVPPVPVPKMSPEALLKDPKTFARAVEQRQLPLAVDEMQPVQARFIARMLFEGRRVFMAEDLLAQAAQKWPDDADLLVDWARIQLVLGRPSSAASLLSSAENKHADRADLHYVLGKALAAVEPTNAALKAKIVAAWEKLLALEPAYRDAIDGGTAAQVSVALDQVRKDQPVRVPGKR